MDMVPLWGFWLSVMFVAYAYLGYPLCLLALSLFKSRPVRKGEAAPTVSFIITAYNEEERMARKLENTLALRYPPDRLEIIVASDHSLDRTDEIVRSCETRGVRLVRAPRRGGKEAAQKLAVQASTGEVLVFSDVATQLAPEAVCRIVRNFADPTVGCVSSVDRFLDPLGRESGEGAYLRYEMFLRGLESKVNTLVGLSGSFFAARREVCRDWAEDLQSDFNTLLNCVRAGMRGVADPESIGFYRDLADGRKEFERKVRTVMRGLDTLMRSLPLLNPLRHGLFSWQLFSHKLCRWMVPFAMASALAFNAALAPGSAFYLGALCVQALFYLAACCAFRKGRASLVPRLPAYFLLVNLSILTAWYRYSRGERLVMWEPSQRQA